MCVDQKKLAKISAVDLYAALTKNIDNSTNIDPFDLIRIREHNTMVF